MEEVIVKVEDLTIAYHDKPVLRDNDINIIKNSVTAVKISLQVRFLSWESPLKRFRRK